MKKRRFLYIITVSFTLCMMLGLGACGTKIELDEKQTDAIGEYAAFTLLRYDASNRSRLVEMSFEDIYGMSEYEYYATPTPEPTPEPTPTPGPESSGGTNGGSGEVIPGESSQNTAGIEKFLGYENVFKFDFVGMSITDSYPYEPDFLVVEAGEGRQMLVVTYKVTNVTDSEQTLNMFDKKASFTFHINNTLVKTALTSFLEDDLSSYQGSFLPGESIRLVLLIEADKGSFDNIETLSLSVRLDGDRFKYKLF